MMISTMSSNILWKRMWISYQYCVCWISRGCVRIHTSWLSMICNCLHYIAMYPFFLVIEYAVSWLFRKKKDKKNMKERITCVDDGLLDFRQWCSSLSVYIYIYIYHRSNEGVKSGLFEPLSHKWIPRLPSGLS